MIVTGGGRGIDATLRVAGGRRRPGFH